MESIAPHIPASSWLADASGALSSTIDFIARLPAETPGFTVWAIAAAGLALELGKKFLPGWAAALAELGFKIAAPKGYRVEDEKRVVLAQTATVLIDAIGQLHNGQTIAELRQLLKQVTTPEIRAQIELMR